MDEIERRLGALELLVMESLAEMGPTQHERIATRLAQHGAAGSDEIAMRAGAQALLGDASRRLETFTGRTVKPVGND